MIDHTGIVVADHGKSKEFAFAPLGASLLQEVPAEFTGSAKVVGYGREQPVLWLSEGGEPGLGRHVAFTARAIDPKWTPFIRRHSLQVGATMVPPAFARIIIRIITRRSSSILTATTSKRFVTLRSEDDL